MVKVSGVVTRGRGKGRIFGFPTVNIALSSLIPSGIYAGKASVGGTLYKAAIFVSVDQEMIEAHLLDFEGDLYGKEIEIEVGKKLREVERFDSEKELIAAIAKDVETVRRGRTS